MVLKECGNLRGKYESTRYYSLITRDFFFPFPWRQNQFLMKHNASWRAGTLLPTDVYWLVLTAYTQPAELTAVRKWWEAQLPQLFYLQRQADKFVLSRAAVFWFLKGWLTTKKVRRGGAFWCPMCYLVRTDCFRVQWGRLLMKLPFEWAAYAWFSPSAAHPAIR